MTKYSNAKDKPVTLSAKDSLGISVEAYIGSVQVEWTQLDRVMELIHKASSEGLTKINYTKEGLTSETWRALYELGYSLVSENGMPLNCYSISWDPQDVRSYE